MITITWSWLSFFAGVFATISAGFWGVVWIAFRQWKKQKKTADAASDFLKSWKANG